MAKKGSVVGTAAPVDPLAGAPYTMADVMAGRPIHVLRPTADRSAFELDDHAMAILSSIKTPVTVMSIIGTQRGGKSTLMNLLHNRTTAGFSVGHYMDPQTTGIWMRMRPHPRNKDVMVLLVDTEGLDSPHVKQDYNWILSALVLLVSNTFVYQTKGMHLVSLRAIHSSLTVAMTNL